MSQTNKTLKALAALAKAVFVLLVLGIVGWAVLASCFSHSSSTSRGVDVCGEWFGHAVGAECEGAQRSSIADVYVPHIAQLGDPGGKVERWYMMHTSYRDALTREEPLLPVGRYLGEYPWCKKAAIPLRGSTDNTSWIWGTPGDAVIVSVMPLFDGDSTDSVIVIQHGAGYHCG